MKTQHCLAIFVMVCLISIPVSGREDRRQEIYNKLYEASCIVQTSDGFVSGTGFCTQTNPIIIVTSRHVFEAAGRNSTWVITRPEWTQRVEVRWVVTAWADVMFFWRRTPMPRGCRLIPLRQKLRRLPRKGEQLFIMGNFFTGDGDKLQTGLFVGKREGHYYCHFQPSIEGSSGSPIVNDRGALVGIHSGETEFYDTNETLERFVPVSELETIIKSVNDSMRGR